MDSEYEQRQQKKHLTVLGVLVFILAAAMIAGVVWRGQWKKLVPKTWGYAFEDYWGKEVPDFEFTDVRGTKYRLSQFSGRPVMVLFWATWCGPCVSEIPGLIKLRKSLGSEELAIVAISSEDQARVSDFAKANNLNYIVAGIGDKNLPQPFGLVDAIPCAFYIDGQGKLKKATVGAMGEKDVLEIIETLGGDGSK